MGMSMKQMMKAVAFAALCMLLMGCVRESMGEGAGKPVRFGARTTVSHITKTAYSGVLDEENEERIDWENGDLIRIISAEVADPADGWFDYDISLTSNSSKYSYASTEPHGADHGLIWGDGTHTFYAYYPAPSTPSTQDGISITIGSHGAEAIAVLPADQSYSVTRTGANGSYYANMNLAYMLAAASAPAGTEVVTLSFTPIVTTFYVTVVNTTGATMTLRRVALSSTVSALCGTFKARMYDVHALDSDHDRNFTLEYSYLWEGNYQAAFRHSDENSTIYADFGGRTLAANEAITVALFAVPDAIDALTLSVTADETGTVSLPLKDNLGNTLSFVREHKHNLNNINVPTVSYAIEVINASDVTVTGVTYDKTGVAGSDQTFYVRSTKTIGGVTYAAPWKAQLRVANTGVDADDWVDMDASNRPAQLENYPLTDEDVAGIPASGTDAGLGEIQRNLPAQPVISHVQKLHDGVVYENDGVTPVDNSTPAKAVDLSRYDFVRRRMEPYQYTANTYIISAPGWYKFPCVYGNAIENGSTAAASYTGAAFRANHLDRFKKMNDFDIATRGPWLEMHGLVNYHRFVDLVWQEFTTWDSANGVAINSGRNDRTSPTISFGPDANVDVITNIGYENDGYNQSNPYVIFYVDPATIRPGNALIATKEDTWLTEDKITWSWQIWITDQDFTPITVNNGTRDYQVMPVNVGWVDDHEGQYFPEVTSEIRFVNISGGVEHCHTGGVTVDQPEITETSTSGWQTYYQWGRKDPFLHNVTIAETGDHLLYQTILHPHILYYEESTYGGVHYYDWTSANYDNLWDSKCLSYGSPSGDLPNHKTVYDPSPRKYCVPPDNAWDGFSTYGYESILTNNINTATYGFWFYTGDPALSTTKTIYFPTSGRVAFATSDCELVDDKVGGFYWTYHASANVQHRISYALKFEGGNSPKVHTVQSDDMHRARGYSIRPVAFDETKLSPVDEGNEAATINLTAQSWSSPNDLRNEPAKTINANPLITVSFGKDNGLSSNLPKYNSSIPAVVLDSNNTVTITSNDPAHKIIEIELIFAENNPESHTLSVSSTSSGSSGAALGEYAYHSEDKRGEWLSKTAACNYATTPPTWSGGETSVTFVTNTHAGDGLYLTGITVYYY